MSIITKICNWFRFTKNNTKNNDDVAWWTRIDSKTNNVDDLINDYSNTKKETNDDYDDINQEIKELNLHIKKLLRICHSAGNINDRIDKLLFRIDKLKGRR